MANELARRQFSDLLPANHQTRKAVLNVQREARIQAARMQAATSLTRIGQQAIAYIANTESCLIGQVPLAEPRLKLLGDVHSGVMAAIVGELSL